MKLIKPIYVSLFHCKAGECNDTCCADWEVDIDEKTLNNYRSLPGDLGDELRRNICYDTTPHFSLCDDGRCPFLDASGLCRIISTLGDGWICDICREHPRYYNRLGDTIECGIGLACEAAAELILSCELPLRFVSEESTVEGEEDADEKDSMAVDYVRSVRQTLFDLTASGSSAYDILSRVYKYAEEADDCLFEIQAGLRRDILAPPIQEGGAHLYDVFVGSTGELLSLEVLDVGFLSDLRGAKAFLDESTYPKNLLHSIEPFAKRLLTYFIHRYLGDAIYDGCLCGRIRLSVLSTLAICLVALSKGAIDLPGFSTVAKDFSKNLEYSTKNTEGLIDFLS
ncbi:MAG: flagellin lysine-N-methylase [Clostridia bacterium]|nr:flagellin lysine-N-methylase [Clostridia bacterium]